MRTDLLDFLACPTCRKERPFEVTGRQVNDAGDVISGTLDCRECRATFDIRDGIPRFVKTAEDYCANFGFQWQEWRTLQIDRLSGHTLSEDRFLADSRWPKDWLAGKLILDAGCGAGRFADVAAGFGATVVAVDLSDAIDACQKTTAVHQGRVHCLQASLLALPLRADLFDAVYCMGVIQHTPDPPAVMRALPTHLKAGGRLAYNFYEEGLWRRLQVVKYLLRLFTPKLSVAANLALSRFLVAALFPLTKILAGIPKIRIVNHFLPIAAVHDPKLPPDKQRAWTLLDTFDWYGARYEKRQHHQAVAGLLSEAGMQAVESLPGLAWAVRPSDDQG